MAKTIVAVALVGIAVVLLFWLAVVLRGTLEVVLVKSDFVDSLCLAFIEGCLPVGGHRRRVGLPFLHPKMHSKTNSKGNEKK